MLDPTPNTEWPALVSSYFSVMISTTVGYGDIVPKDVRDILVVIICMIVGTIVVGYCLGEASSTFKHNGRKKTEYQEDVYAVERFMSEHEIPKVNFF